MPRKRYEDPDVEEEEVKVYLRQMSEGTWEASVQLQTLPKKYAHVVITGPTETSVMEPLRCQPVSNSKPTESTSCLPNFESQKPPVLVSA